MLNIKNLKAGYEGKIIVDLPDFFVKKSGQCLIRGASGSGKTTLLHTVSGLIEPINGDILIDGVNILGLKHSEMDRFRGKRIGIVFQSLYLIKSLSVVENILLGAFVNNVKQDIEQAKELAERLEIIDILNQSAAKISQGQAQRVAIARALLNKPDLLLADEPTSGLDRHTAMQVMKLLKSLTSTLQTTLLVSSHDERIAGEFDQVLDIEKVAVS
jgi:putative ABC transport system ATP-binding protein